MRRKIVLQVVCEAAALSVASGRFTGVTSSYETIARELVGTGHSASRKSPRVVMVVLEQKKVEDAVDGCDVKAHDAAAHLKVPPSAAQVLGTRGVGRVLDMWRDMLTVFC